MENVRARHPCRLDDAYRRPPCLFRQAAGTIKKEGGPLVLVVIPEGPRAPADPESRDCGASFCSRPGRTRVEEFSWRAGGRLPAWRGRRGLVRAYNTVPGGTD